MNTFVVTGLAAAMLLAVVPGAEAGHVEPVGALCEITSVSDPNVDAFQSGELDGALVFPGRGVPPALLEGVLTCTVQLGDPATHATHAAPDAASLRSDEGRVAFVAGIVVYAQGRTDTMFVCTSATVAGETVYHDAVNAAWSHDPGVACDEVRVAYGG